MKLKSILVASAAFAVMMPTQAFAAPISSEEAAALLKRLNQLEQEVISLREKLRNVETVQLEQAEQAAEVQEATQKSDGNSIKWKSAPELKGDDGWSFKPRGRVQYDFAHLSGPSSINAPGLGFSNEARRIRLGASGKVSGGFGYKLEVDFLDNVVITDAFLDYKAGEITVTIGQHNPFQSLEELSSSNDTSFIERSAFTDAFNFERKIGISVAVKKGDILAQGGVFTDNLRDLDDGNDSIGFDGRIVYAPKFGDTQLHFGGSFHWRDLSDNITSIRYRQRPLIHSVDTRFINTDGVEGTTNETSYGLEAAVISGRFHAAAETHWAKLSRTAMPNPTFFGGSIEAGIFLTDDSREYKGGFFRGVKVKNPVGSGGLGAWQFNLRYDRLDLVDAGIIGGTQDGYMASLIWTPVDYVRFMLNYGHLAYGNALGIVAGAPSDYSVDVVAARAQISF